MTTVVYAGREYELEAGLTGAEVTTLITEVLNRVADLGHRQEERGHAHSEDDLLRPAEGLQHTWGRYDPFVVLPLRNGGLVHLLVHDRAAVVVTDPTGPRIDVTALYERDGALAPPVDEDRE